LFINARTDVYLKRLVAPEAMLEETLKRGWALKQAGASGLFVPLALDPDAIKAIAAEVSLPMNVMSWAGAPKAAALKEFGVKRLSAGGGMAMAAWEALRAAATAFLADGDSDALRARAGAPVNYNEWFRG
jgi:2-methylisocitrate lyase-like PEP mutase family enzyme